MFFHCKSYGFPQSSHISSKHSNMNSRWIFLDKECLLHSKYDWDTLIKNNKIKYRYFCLKFYGYIHVYYLFRCVTFSRRHNELTKRQGTFSISSIRWYISCWWQSCRFCIILQLLVRRFSGTRSRWWWQGHDLADLWTAAVFPSSVYHVLIRNYRSS